MRIALVCPYAWEAAGGVQVHVKNLAARLLERGHEATVLAPTTAEPSEPWVRSVGRPLRISYQGTVAPVAPLSYRRTRAALASFRPDVVHVHEPLSPSASMFATLAAKARTLPEATLEIVPNGVDITAFVGAEPRGGLPEGRRILWVNRLDAQKGFPVALAAFSKVLAEVPEAVLIVVGEGKDHEALALLTGSARARVDMRGTEPNERVPFYLAACEAFVSPAVGQESFGIALVEAMAAGVPVVATDIPGYREVVSHGIEGLLVPPRDPEALAAGLVRVLTEPGLASRLGEAGRERARSFDWAIVVDRLEELYLRAVESAGYDRRR